MTETTPLVGIIMGSQSDWTTMRRAGETLDRLDIPWEARVTSAHRTPERLHRYATEARDRGLKVIIAGAGMAAALPGSAAAVTPLPVLGVPMEGSLMGGLDALLAMAQMPPGIPVGTLGIGRAGATNAALLAAAILALGDSAIADRLDAFRAAQTAAVPEIPGEEA
ncbi:MAG: 5-(carboxyamino)imidazole ribonucleotide mutase [Rhodospirillales bacterium]|nr:MAG: 5-(carboxyamino)imidazole ribonucleotide mutase [Rhodospirillales bacterium]